MCVLVYELCVFIKKIVSNFKSIKIKKIQKKSFPTPSFKLLVYAHHEVNWHE